MKQKSSKVYAHTLAKQILFDENKPAKALQSPQLLTLSGVGSSHTRKEHNKSVVSDRPGVGQIMCDHVVLVLGAKSMSRPTAD